MNDEQEGEPGAGLDPSTKARLGRRLAELIRLGDSYPDVFATPKPEAEAAPLSAADSARCEAIADRLLDSFFWAACPPDGHGDSGLREVWERWLRATGGHWHACLGSGRNVLTAVSSEAPGRASVPVCDTLPDWMRADKKGDHRPDLRFLEHAHEDVGRLALALLLCRGGDRALRISRAALRAVHLLELAVPMIPDHAENRAFVRSVCGEIAGLWKLAMPELGAGDLELPPAVESTVLRSADR